MTRDVLKHTIKEHVAARAIDIGWIHPETGILAICYEVTGSVFVCLTIGTK